MVRCNLSGPSKPKNTLAKPTKAKLRPTKGTKSTGKKTPAKTPKSKKNGAGNKGGRKTKPPKRKTNRRLPENHHFPFFHGYCCKNVRDAGIKQSADITMVQAAKCWKELSEDQKEHFVRKIKPKFKKGWKRPPSPPP